MPEDTRQSFVESFFCVTNYNPKGAKNGVLDFVNKVNNKTYDAQSVLENISFPQGKAHVQSYYEQSMDNLLVLRNLDTN